MSKKNPTKADLKAMGLVPDGKGGYKVKSKTPMLDNALKQVEGSWYEKVHTLTKESIRKQAEEIFLDTHERVMEHTDSIIKGNPIQRKSYQLTGRPSMHPTNEIFITGEVMSSKNSRRNFGTTSLVSEACAKYKKNSAVQWQTWQVAFWQMCKGKEKPYRVQFRFVRRTKRTCDFHNMVQVLCDLMCDYKWLDDDNMNEMVPVPPLTGPVYTISKTNPGVYISVL